MRITQPTRAYNERRYGKPWIATVDFTNPIKGTYKFGQWIGAIGEAGELIVDADAGDIVAKGQKDKGSSDAPEYYVVKQDGSLERLPEKIDAYRAWQTKHAAVDAAKPTPTDLSAVPTEDLMAELRRRGALA